MDLIGARIGHVKIETLLAAGGMGEVYRGFDEILERAVAVKIIRGDHRMSPLLKARFLREARVLSRLEHPNICRIYDIVKGEDCDYLLLELIEGSTLRQACKQGLNIPVKLAIAEQIAGALAAAHAEQIVHRDLKPDNVMVTKAQIVKILDFGLARPILENVEPEVSSQLDSNFEEIDFDDSSKTIRGSIIGTLGYMSPEQARGEAVSEASDMYSFGILLQELITESPVYEWGNDHAKLYDLVHEGKTLSATNLDPDIIRLLEDLKSLDPSSRPTARETATRLALIRQKPLRAKEKRRRTLMAVLFSIFLILTAWASYWFARPEPLLQPWQEGRIALLPFSNQTGSSTEEWISIGLMDMVAETLDTNPQLDIIPTDSVLKMTEKQKLFGVTRLNINQINRICKTLGSQFVITATVSKSEEVYKINYTIYDARGFASSQEITGRELTTLAGDLTAYLSRRLAPDHLIRSIKDRYSLSEIANQNYATGVQRLNTVGPKIAQNYFLVSIDLDPKFLWAELKLATCKELLGEYKEGEELLNRILLHAREKMDHKLEAECLRGLGVLCKHRKDMKGAEKFWRQSLAIVHRLRDRQGEAKILNNLAVIAFNEDDLSKAEELYKKSLDLKRKIGDRQGEAYTLNNLAIVEGQRGKLDEEEKLHRQSLMISRQIGELEAQAFSLGNLGEVYADRGNYSEAIKLQKETLSICRQLGDQEGQAVASLNLAQAFLAIGRPEEAKTYLDQSQEWFQDDELFRKLLSQYESATRKK